MKITSRQELCDYMLRQLGAPVINIEVDDQHLDDAIENAIEYYTEYYFDGVVRDFLVHKLTGSEIFITNSQSFTAGETIVNANGVTRASIASVTPTSIIINRQIGFTKFAVGDVITSNSNNSATISSITIGDIDVGYITIDESIVSVNKILNITSVLGSSDYMFNMQYQIMLQEVQMLSKGGASMYWSTMNYLSHLDFIMKKEKNFTFHRRMNRLMLEISWSTDVKVGDLICAEIYRAIDETQFTQVFNDRWLKRYSTALLKKQWGTNLKKYTGVQLPGGMTYNGQSIFDEAVAEIAELEALALSTSAPLNFEIG